MVMIAQQTIRVNLPIGFLAGRGQRFQEILPVHVIQEYILTSVTPAHRAALKSGQLREDHVLQP